MKTINKLLLLMTGIGLLFIQTITVSAETHDRFPDFSAKFELTNADGQPVTEQVFTGRYTLMGFGFTQCHHICPMMARNMALALKNGPTNARGIFVSVDTERDTPAITQAYASSFSDSLTGLGGDYEQVRKAANNFKVSFVVTKSQKAYTVEHTSDIFLIGPDGMLIEVFALNASPKDIAAAMGSPAD